MIDIFTGEFTILILQKYGFLGFCNVVWFYSTHFKVCIHLPCINTQRRTTSPFDITPVISSSNHRTTGLYQGSADRSEVDRNSGIIRLLQPFQTIRYCNQSVLAIVPELSIFVFSNRIVDHILRSALVRFSLLCESYLYNSTGLRLYIFVL